VDQHEDRGALWVSHLVEYCRDAARAQSYRESDLHVEVDHQGRPVLEPATKGSLIFAAAGAPSAS
jgi:hypothetical protein